MKLTFNWPGRVYITSDPHFGDLDILNSERKNKFNSIEEHDNTIKSVIKKTMFAGNTLVLLGDLGEGWQDFIKSLKCYKVLVVGNHDTKSREYYLKYFDEVYLTEIPATDLVTLSHQPVVVSEHKINVHGHLHDSYLGIKRNYMNANIHMCKYELLNLKDIDTQARKIEYSDRFIGPKALFQREWYAKHYVFENKEKNDYFKNSYGEPSKIDWRYEIILNTMNFIAMSEFGSDSYADKAVINRDFCEQDFYYMQNTEELWESLTDAGRYGKIFNPKLFLKTALRYIGSKFCAMTALMFIKNRKRILYTLKNDDSKEVQLWKKLVYPLVQKNELTLKNLIKSLPCPTAAGIRRTFIAELLTDEVPEEYIEIFCVYRKNIFKYRLYKELKIATNLKNRFSEITSEGKIRNVAYLHKIPALIISTGLSNNLDEIFKYIEENEKFDLVTDNYDVAETYAIINGGD